MLTNQIVCSSIILPEIKSRVMRCEFVHYGRGGWREAEGHLPERDESLDGHRGACVCMCMSKRG